MRIPRFFPHDFTTLVEMRNTTRPATWRVARSSAQTRLRASERQVNGCKKFLRPDLSATTRADENRRKPITAAVVRTHPRALVRVQLRHRTRCRSRRFSRASFRRTSTHADAERRDARSRTRTRTFRRRMRATTFGTCSRSGERDAAILESSTFAPMRCTRFRRRIRANKKGAPKRALSTGPKQVAQ